MRGLKEYKYCPLCGQPLEVRLEEEKKRKYCPKDNWFYYPQVGLAAGILIIKDKKVLMVQRARSPYKGSWMFPAGFINYGEHPKDAVKREVNEEIGLKIKNLKLIDIQQVIDDPRSPKHIFFLYRGEIGKGKITNKDTNENSKVGWKNIDNPPKIGWKIHNKFMQKLQKNIF